MADIFERLADIHYIFSLLIAIAAGATVWTVAQIFLETDKLSARMKSVSTERERIRARERERLARGNKANLRPEAKAFMAQIVERFSADKWLGTGDAKAKLAAAGYRGQGAEVTFLFFRLVSPVAFAFIAAFYIFVLVDFGFSLTMKVGICVAAMYLGIKAPELALSNTTTKRRESLKRSFPDALDLLLICVESGMSIEHACRRVSQEIGAQSIPMAEELTLVTAELSYLQDRRAAFENFAKRTGVESIKSLATVLIQSEKYGTPLGASLRVLAQEGRDMRMVEAERKAAALPPKLTVPMIVFFLPVLFVIIGTPAGIQIANSQMAQ